MTLEGRRAKIAWLVVMTPEVVVREGARRWKIPERNIAGARNSGVATPESVSVVSMKCIFRIRSVSGTWYALICWPCEDCSSFLRRAMAD